MILIEHGEIIEMGSHEALMAQHGNYDQLVSGQPLEQQETEAL
jgi:ABC-type multidrug transport system fused ATPase/permease subunit